ncbi:MAG: alpha-glucosidase [Acutalibacteraceae bacterium]|nr:alpha-glucosidase [Oscillospiraceae bacterium]
MKAATVTRDTTINEVLASPVGSDLLNKVLYSAGLSSSVITKTPIGKLKLGSLKKLSMGKLDDGVIDALISMLNCESDIPASGDVSIQHKWWKEAVFYQIYPRSFKDSNGDGIGDLNGIIEKLDYLKALGVDAIWCSPIYDSPNDDNGYDIRDYRAIMREFGTMEDFDRLLSEIHKRGMKLIMDLVINHSSDEHEWFKSSVSDPDSPYRDYYIWRDGDENTPPNNWTSIFSGPAWNYYPERKQWAMHLFTKKQMDFNWENENLRKDLYDMINWWLDKGIDGFRMDVISFISKADGLPDGNEVIGTLMGFKGVEHYFYGPKLHTYLREMRENTFGNYDAFTIGECQGTGIEMSKLMTGDDRGELDTVFSFDHMDNPGKKRFQKYTYDLRPMAKELVKWQLGYGNHCWPVVFFENHDWPRMTSKVCPDGKYREEVSKLLAMMQMTFKGTPFIYQGEEIGMTNIDFQNINQFRDVESLNLYKELIEKGKSASDAFETVLAGSRDHARTPMQWTDGDNGGFTTGTPWIEVNKNHKYLNVKAQENDEFSVLNFYRSMIALRHETPTLVYGDFILPDDKFSDVLTYFRADSEEEFLVEMNLTAKERPRKTGTDGYTLVKSNYCAIASVLRPFEANIYRKNK